MSTVKVLALILGMALVTYIPRAVPAALYKRLRFGNKIEKFLKLIPYTAMSALIFPGVFATDSANPLIGIAGAVAAGLLAWRKFSVILCVLAAIAVDFIIYALIGVI